MADKNNIKTTVESMRDFILDFCERNYADNDVDNCKIMRSIAYDLYPKWAEQLKSSLGISPVQIEFVKEKKDN